MACAHLGDFSHVRDFDSEMEALFIQSNAYAQFVFYSGLISAFLNSGQFEAAEKHMDAARNIAHKNGGYSVQSKIDFMEIVAAIRQSDYHKGNELLDSFIGFIYFRLHDYPKAEIAIGKATAYFKQESYWLFLAECFFANTLVAYEIENFKAAKRYLKMGLAIAERHRYNFFLIICPDDFRRFCAIALELLEDDQTEFMKFFLQSKLITQTTHEPGAFKSHSNPKVRRRMREIEHSRYLLSLPKFSVQILGAFDVHKMGPARERIVSKGQMPQKLFKLIIAQGGNSIPVDIIKEYLWPDAKPDKVADMFKSTLYRLRKILEPDMPKTFGSSYINFEKQRISIVSDLFEIDFQLFLLSKKRAKKIQAYEPKNVRAL